MKLQHFSKTKKQKGFTLIELLIAVTLFIIIVSIAVGGFTTALKTQRQVASLISAQSNVSLVLEQMAREIRTGYQFCHDPSSATPSSSCSGYDGLSGNFENCVVGDSGYTDIISGYDTANGDLPVWTCPALDFYNAQGDHVNYSLIDGALQKSDSSVGNSLPQSITGDAVSVKYVKFIIFGAVEGDNWTPRVTIAIGITPSSTDAAVSNDVLNLQTSVSAREIDCDTTTDPASC